MSPATVLVYALAALAEIAGCFAFWAWLRNSQSPLWLIPGVGSLILFAWLLTLVPTEAAGRAYAAYGGVYIAASLLWLWLVEKSDHEKDLSVLPTDDTLADAAEEAINEHIQEILHGR